MPATSDCPDARTLEAFVLSRLHGTEADRIEEHLGECAACLTALDGLLNGDTVADAVRRHAAAAGLPETPAVHDLIEHVRRMRADSAALGETVTQDPPARGEGAAVGAPVYDFLVPPERPDEMGRLGGYRVLRVLGQGGMGTVFFAEDPGLRRKVALKTMRGKMALLPTSRERFLREARAAAALKHDHVVTIYQVGEERGVPFIAMELLQGESLEERLKRERRLPVAEVVRIGKEAAAGLAAAHAAGLVHRDVKPANLWLEAERSCRVKVLDFGLARLEDEEGGLTEKGMALGTLGYIAPEHAEGIPATARTDLYALGVVLFKMLTGRLPLRGQTVREALRSQAPDTPAELANLVLRLLADNPEDRPASAAAVAAELGRLEEQRRSRGQSRRLRWAAAAALLGLLGAFAGGVVIKIFDKEGKLEKEVSVGKDKTFSIVPAPGTEDQPDPGKQVFRFGRPLSPHALVQRPALLPGVRSWTLETTRNRGRRLPCPQLLGDDMQPVSLSPDGRQVAVVGVDRTIRIYDVAGRKLEKALLHPSGEAWGCAWSPDGKRLLSHSAFAAHDETTAFVWDTTSGRLCLEVHERDWIRACWSPDGKQLATLAESGLTVWETATGRKVHHNPDVRPTAGSFAWSGRNDRVAVSRGKQVEIWDLHSPKPLRTWEEPEAIGRLVWSPDGRVLAGFSWPAKPLRLWDPATGKPLPLGAGAPESATTGAFSPDGKSLAVAGWGQIEMCDPVSGIPSRRIPYDGSNAYAGSLSWSQDGTKLACLHDSLRGARVIESASGRPLFEVQSHPECIFCRWSPDGRTIATCEATCKSPDLYGSFSRRYALRTWDLLTGRAGPALADVARAAFAPDGQSLAVISAEKGQVAIHECRSLAPRKELPQPLGRVDLRDVWWSGDGKTIAAANEKTVRLWDAASGGVLRDLTLQQPHPERGGLAGSPDGKVLAVSVEGPPGIEMWPLGDANGQAAAPRLVPLPVPRAPLGFRWSPDGTNLVSLGIPDVNPLLILDAKSEKELRRLPRECCSAGWSGSGVLRALRSTGELQQGEGEDSLLLARVPPASEYSRFSADARHVALHLGGHTEESSPLWLRKSSNGEPTAVLVPLLRNRWLAVSPEGHYLASEGTEKELVYVVENDDGRQETLDPDAFANRFHWKNDPTRVRPLGDDQDSFDVASFRPPPKAVVLCDGSSLDAWRPGDAKRSGDGLAIGRDTLVSKEDFGGRYRLHVEFRLPPRADPKTPGPARSGLLVQGRYQLCLADSFGLAPDTSGCGALAGVKAPAQKACRPAGAWQSLEVEFDSPVCRGDQVVQHAKLAAWLNDFPVQRADGVLPTAGALDDRVAGSGPIALVGGGEGIQFRNIWLLPLPAPAR